MPNPNTNFKDSFGTDLGNRLITKEYLMSVYPQIANQLITPELWVWGGNFYGQLGINNNNSPICTPITTFAGGANWKQVSGAAYHFQAIKTDGTLWGWGSSDYLGINLEYNSIFTPVQEWTFSTNWKQVSCGGQHTAAIKTDGTLWVWGFGFATGVGIGNSDPTILTPVTTFAGGTNWKQVSCGNYHTAAIKTDGTLWTWGVNAYGSLGNNLSIEICTPVTTFAGGTNWKQVSSGGSQTAAIKTDGTLWIWGGNYYISLGTLDSIKNKSTPVTTFAGGTNWKQVSVGYANCAAIKTDGTLWTWGVNTQGQLGNNTLTNSTTPVTTFTGGTNWKQVACFGSGTIGRTAAIKTDGTLWTWGDYTEGQLGNNAAYPFYLGNNDAIKTPITTFAGGTNWKQVCSAPYITAAIRTSDDLQGI